jgi:gas vesicle protein
MPRKNNRGLVVIERGGGAGGLLWLLVGGVVGAGLGLLLAPHSGKKTRALIGERLATLKASAEEAFDGLTEEGQSLLEADEEEEKEDGEEEGASRSGETGEDDDTPSREEEPRRKAPTPRAELEQRLARARTRRHRELAEEDEEPVA